MATPNRKPTRLPDFSYNTPGAYFITICTIQRKNLLSRIVGGGALDAPENRLTTAGAIVEKYIRSAQSMAGIHVDKYVIMPNHIHLILFVDDTAYSGTSRAPSPTNAKIPHFVSALKRFCNRDIGENIFQRSYHDHIIRGEADYLKIWEYIDNNPKKWELDRYYHTD